MKSQSLIHLIADYGVGDPAFAEVIQKLKFLDSSSSLTINPVPVPRYSTLATGFWIAQLATINSFEGLAIYSNTAPRKKVGEDKTQTFKGQFGQLAYTKLQNGVHVIAVHYGFAFSFLKRFMKNFYLVNISNIGTQFRSRDNYPEAVVGLIQDNKKFVGEEINIATIPEVVENSIAFIDGFENIKTTNRVSKNKFKSGQKVEIKLNDVVNIATVADQAYHISDGEMVYAPGSSGGEDRFMEIWVRGGSAYKIFNKPRVEQGFSIEPS